MKRLVKHKTVLHRILKDERLSPNKRLLGEMLYLWLDVDDPENKKEIMSLIQATYGSPRRVLWKDGDSPQLIPSLSKIEAEAQASLKEFFAQAQEDAEDMKNEILAEGVHPPS